MSGFTHQSDTKPHTPVENAGTSGNVALSDIMERAVKITYDEAERIILDTEPAALSDKGDKIWTRRMAVALADLFNAKLETLTAAPASAEPVAWIPLARWNELNKPGEHVAIQTLVHRDEPRKPEQYFPLYARPEVTP